MSASKNILFASSWYPNESDPFLGNFVRRQALLLSQTHHVAVLNTVPRSTADTISVDKRTEGNLTEIYVYHPQGESLFSKRRLQKKALNRGIKELSYKPDVLMTQIMLPKGWQFDLLMKKFNIPWIHLEQGSYFRISERKNWSFLQKMIIRKCNRSIDSLLAASDFVRKDLKEVFPERKIDLVPNHIDTDLFTPAESKINRDLTRFLHISTLDPKTKDPLGIIDACKIVTERTEDTFELTIVSDGNTDEILNYIKTKGLENTVIVTGAKQWEELPNYYHNSDAFILNSIYETFSIVLAESWACGIPTITTPVGIGYSLSEDLGYNTVIGDPSSLAEAMLKMIQNKRSFNSETIRQKGLNYSSEKVLDLLNNQIEHVCK